MLIFESDFVFLKYEWHINNFFLSFLFRNNNRTLLYIYDYA